MLKKWIHSMFAVMMAVTLCVGEVLPEAAIFAEDAVPAEEEPATPAPQAEPEPIPEPDIEPEPEPPKEVSEPEGEETTNEVNEETAPKEEEKTTEKAPVTNPTGEVNVPAPVTTVEGTDFTVSVDKDSKWDLEVKEIKEAQVKAYQELIEKQFEEDYPDSEIVSMMMWDIGFKEKPTKETEVKIEFKTNQKKEKDEKWQLYHINNGKAKELKEKDEKFKVYGDSRESIKAISFKETSFSPFILIKTKEKEKEERTQIGDESAVDFAKERLKKEAVKKTEEDALDSVIDTTPIAYSTKEFSFFAGAARGIGDPVNLPEGSVDITVWKLENGDWVEVESNGSVEEGQEVKIELDYHVSAHLLDKDHNQVTYQFPSQILPKSEKHGPIISKGVQVGEYILDTTGKLVLTYYDSFKYEEPFNGRFTFEGTVTEGSGGIDTPFAFDGTGIQITVTKPDEPEPGPGEEEKPKTDINIRKSGGPVNVDDNGYGSQQYSIVVSTINGTGDSVTIHDKIADDSTINASYDQNSFQVWKVKGDKRESITVSPSITGSEFEIENLAPLEEGEQYIVDYRIRFSGVKEGSWDKSGASTVRNSASANNRWTSETTQVTTSKLNKWGSYDQYNDVINWTIEVLNPSGNDLGGKKIHDILGGES